MLLVFLAIVLTAPVLSWSEEAKLSNSKIAPAAAGIVNYSLERNGNTEVELKVEHLAKPAELSPAKSEYVVWVQPRGNSAINAGTLKVNDNLEGSLKFTTPYRSFELIVTAEDNAMSGQASTMEVLRGSVQIR